MWTLTEQHDVDGPIVYGYLRLHRSTPEWQAALTLALTQYCDQHELELCGMFTDRGTASAESPAFAGLLDVLLLSRAYGVVLPTAHHLGGKHVAARRRARLDEIGARLLFVRGPLRRLEHPRPETIDGYQADSPDELWQLMKGVAPPDWQALPALQREPKG
ncbi:hypothetical protein AB0C27_09860 [Nonomuraea sp. NPDC048882]|uniref:hypothetical protein n=1 Tax=Nonomuraea sp. NPDC048882 TaxID=3154347 RepID=UPI0034098BCA